MKKTVTKHKQQIKKEKMKYDAKIVELEERTKALESGVNAIWDQLKTGKGKIIRCESCGYSWRTETALKNVSCPSCGQKTPSLTDEEKRRIQENPDYVPGKDVESAMERTGF